MKLLRSALAGILALLTASAAVAQTFPTVPYHTVIGRLGVPGDTGPSQAIPFATFTNQMIGTAAPSYPLTHPSSSNLLCAGQITAHTLWWADQNLCSTADTWILNSSDPSALLSITVAGTITNLDTVSLTFKFGSGACVAPTGCTVTANVTGASTVTTIAAALVTAVKANANLYNDVAGAQKQILRISNTAGQIDIDFDSRVAMIVTRTVTGAATETVTVPANCAAACDKQWDVNPTLQMGRLVTGLAPPANSQMFGLIVQGGNSASPSAYATQYGVFANTVLSSTSGALSSKWTLLTPDVNGVINQGLVIGGGIYTPARTDKGVNTANFSESWTADVDSITRSGAVWIFNATTNDKIQHLSGTVSATLNNGGFSLDIGDSAATTILRVGTLNTRLGQLYLTGSTSGTAVITPQAVAGATTLTLPNASGTFAVSASSPLAISATTGNATCATCVTSSGGGAITGTAPIAVSAAGVVSITSPLPVANGGTALASGTSGGVLYYSAAGTLASSGALAAAGIVVGGGAGATPTTPSCTLDANGSLTCAGSVASTPQILMTNSTNDANAHFYIARKDRAGAAVQSGDAGFSFINQMFANSAYRNAAQMLFAVDAAPSGSNVPSSIAFVTSNAAGLLNQTIKWNSAGHLKSTPAASPTLSAGCNGAGSSVSGSDLHGTVTGQTAAATTCTLTFATAYAATPDCVASGLTSPLTGAVTPSTTTLVVNFASTATYKFTYTCHGA